MHTTWDSESAQIRRHLAAGPDLVFEAFADAGLVRRWPKPAPEIRLDVLAYDFRPGGRYRFAYHVPGTATMHVNGAFAVVEPPSRIVFSWNIEPPDEHAGIESEVSILIRPAGQGSDMLIRHVKLTRIGAAERHANGWGGALDGLARLLAEVQGNAT
jgi:uncharacterized protein YndB with AHSA1/START domain